MTGICACRKGVVCCSILPLQTLIILLGASFRSFNKGVRNDVCEDMRKLSVSIAIAGVIGILVSGGTITAENGLVLFIAGWIIGLSIRWRKSCVGII
ncbi:MAG: hypothetical protein QM500_09725 [Methylococcales bacterium]